MLPSPSPATLLSANTNLVVASTGEDKKISLWRNNRQGLGTVPVTGKDGGDSGEECLSAISFSRKGSSLMASFIHKNHNPTLDNHFIASSYLSKPLRLADVTVELVATHLATRRSPTVKTFKSFCSVADAAVVLEAKNIDNGSSFTR
ncbi:unnamed protein product [Microthlaspi erraticum]|uniref:Uncharacterized protein n=1 Tax=Microthlaspi erraticum TaxID=1685480 RepID=A0A6D2JDA8_9BRAS|nr:unnamed protein product [Microthlaspi erraticum]